MVDDEEEWALGEMNIDTRHSTSRYRQALYEDAPDPCDPCERK